MGVVREIGFITFPIYLQTKQDPQMRVLLDELGYAPTRRPFTIVSMLLFQVGFLLFT